MPLVKCIECGHWVSNKTKRCPNCGFEPKGPCKSCRYFESNIEFDNERCLLTENDFVKKDKNVCPAVIRKFIFYYFD